MPKRLFGSIPIFSSILLLHNVAEVNCFGPSVAGSQPTNWSPPEPIVAESRLELLSESPLMLSSQEPLLSFHECKILSDHFNGKEESQGPKILKKLQLKLDKKLMRDSEEGPVKPRFLKYEPTLAEPATSSEQLLPDGLHVDTNNGFLLRYLSVLVYLNSSFSSATNFPLAVPLNQNMDHQLHYQAKELLESNILHTGFVHDNPSAEVLHQAGFDIYWNPQNPVGVTVLPRQGHMLAFWNIDPSTGAADPFSWHGAEALAVGDKKEVLTFFYEIPPMMAGGTQSSFGAEVGRRKEMLLHQYGRANLRSHMLDADLLSLSSELSKKKIS